MSFLPSFIGLVETTVTVKGVARPIDHDKRDALLAEAAAVLARRGVVDTSLRALAAEMGTSARMLIFYFGSKENLILEMQHDLRHTAAYRMARDPEMPLTDVQWVLGHAVLSTTQIYTTLLRDTRSPSARRSARTRGARYAEKSDSVAVSCPRPRESRK
jgi:AcrR family transcriptional regulator